MKLPSKKEIKNRIRDRVSKLVRKIYRYKGENKHNKIPINILVGLKFIGNNLSIIFFLVGIILRIPITTKNKKKLA